MFRNCFDLKIDNKKSTKKGDKDIVFDQIKENNILLIEILNSVKKKNEMKYTESTEYTESIETIDIKLNLILHKINEIKSLIENGQRKRTELRLW